MNPYDPSSIQKFIQFLTQQRDSQGRATLAELRRAAADPSNDTRTLWLLGPYLPESNGWAFDSYRLVATLFALYAQRFTIPNGGYDIPRFENKDEDISYNAMTDNTLSSTQPKWVRKSFGASLRRLRNQLSAGEESLDQRFVALLDTNREDIGVPLRGFVQRLASSQLGIPVDFKQLLTDLLHWDGQHTRRQWARDYWQPITTDHLTDEPAV